MFGYIRKGLTCSFSDDCQENSEEIRFFIDVGCLIKETYIQANYASFPTSHRCLSAVEMYLFPKRIITDPGFLPAHADLLNNYIFSISVKSVSSQIFASLMKKKSALQKVAAFLFGFYLFSGKKRSFKPPFCQMHLGSLLGITKFTINRIIHYLTEQNFLEKYTSKNIIIIDPARLAFLSES